jgi:prevent-host-death family protein
MPTKPTETIAISEFKATCLAVLERVRRTGTSIVVTKRGEPVAEINPPSPASTGDGWLGSMRGTATMADDLVAPASAKGDWEAFGA